MSFFIIKVSNVENGIYNLKSTLLYTTLLFKGALFTTPDSLNLCTSPHNPVCFHCSTIVTAQSFTPILNPSAILFPRSFLFCCIFQDYLLRNWTPTRLTAHQLFISFSSYFIFCSSHVCQTELNSFQRSLNCRIASYCNTLNCDLLFFLYGICIVAENFLFYFSCVKKYLS